MDNSSESYAHLENSSTLKHTKYLLNVYMYFISMHIYFIISYIQGTEKYARKHGNLYSLLNMAHVKYVYILNDVSHQTKNVGHKDNSILFEMIIKFPV